jgi:glycosidase
VALASRRRLLVALTLVGCGNDGLQSATGLMPPETDGYDPSNGNADNGGYYSTSGSGDESGAETGAPTDCEDENKKCAHAFTLADAGYGMVDVVGNFAPDGWEAGVPMALGDGTWTAVLPLPWGSDTEYKFRIDGGAPIPDPDNPNTVPDGNGGESSVVAAAMCDDFTCEPNLLGDFDWRDAIIYFVFVDRFFNGDASNDGGIGVPAASDWQGGDWAGVAQKIDEGYFDELGINVLWLTVPLDNTNASGLGVDGMDYSAYHGYWPADLDGTEEHFGSMGELQALVDAAHEHGLKVIFDYAMNHVHESSPAYADHPGWFWPNDNGSGGNCVCGQGCGWEGPGAKRCWFTDYLPDFDFSNAEARAFSVGNAVQWILDTGVDGYRLDAVKHIEDEWLLELRERVAAEIEPETGEHFYMVGETYTGDRGLIAYYVQPDMLDGQFDFPLRMEMARTVLMRQGSMNDLADFMDGNDGFYGAGIMSTFIGNHDIPRAIHLAEDTPLWTDPWSDGKDRAWNNTPGLPSGMSAFQRLGNAFTILMTTPGAPLVYYGDEYGMAGAGDPDNRRFMQWSGYSGGQQALRDHVAALIQIRKDHAATRRGTRETLDATDNTFTYSVSFGGDAVWVALNRADASSTAGGLPAEDLVDALTGDMLAGPSVTVPARSALVLTRPAP